MRNATTVAVLTWLVAAPAQAVLIRIGDGTGNVALDPTIDPGFSHMGVRGNSSAVYLGNGVVLTANHVGPGNVQIGGTVYSLVSGSERRLRNEDGSRADLVLFQIHPRPDLPPLEIAEKRPGSGAFLVLMGHGRNRGTEVWWDPNGPDPPDAFLGYVWKPGRTMRWGTNFAEVFPTGRILGTQAFGSSFDYSGSFAEGQAVPGDSGGAVFAWNGPSRGFSLAGLIIAISIYADQPASTTYYGQVTYYADLAHYRDDIIEQIQLPEPSGGFWSGATLVALLGRHRVARGGRSRGCGDSR